MEDVVSFIIHNYSGASKIVEVGVGAFPFIASSVKKLLPNVKVIVTDVNYDRLMDVGRRYPWLNVAYDDVFNPRLEIYEGASLIYSIRPPPEMVPAMVKIALIVKSDLLIRPLTGEEAGFNASKLNWRSVRYGKALLKLLSYRKG